ncbi:hypothetical protein G7Y89_g5564 [Cudoniella acicularis]|uniref:Uncharacterized protein n=1 Tax=Cudoniella acicularis TaxID=354080 RepID=A0A8H4RNM7_9HELO|nr:hypothetical protein G7Y89_g5564 [Cudoniella acicularis]
MFRFALLSRKWKFPKVLIALMVVELGATVAALALFAIADPDLFRTALWQIGSDNGFNSSPLQILYAYANYRPIPTTPFVWSQTLTSFNVAVSVLCTFIMIVKAVMFALHVWFPLLATVTNLILTVLWIVSVYGQAGPDHSDPNFPSNVAWYISKSCSYAKPSGNYHYCLMAKGTFGVSVFLMLVFFANFALGVWSMIPSAAQRAADRMEIDDMQSEAKMTGAGNESDSNLEMKHVQKAAAVPYTPRTLAFHTLDRKLPLRSDNPKPRFT